MQVTLVNEGRPARLFGWSATPGVTTTTSVSNSNPQYKVGPYSSFQAILTGTGAVTATIVIQVSNDDTFNTSPSTMSWCQTPLGTITLSGTNSVSDGFTSNATWKYVRAQVTAISGTG